MRMLSRLLPAIPFIVTLACEACTAPQPQSTPPTAEPSPVENNYHARQAPPPPPAAPAALPRAEDVLPPREVSSGSLVVRADGYRFQVPPVLQPVTLPNGIAAYRGSVPGVTAPAELTMYVTHAPFPGDLDALTVRERADVTSHGGTIAQAMAPTTISIAGTTGSAARIQATVGRVDELRVLAVHDGEAYVFHCETPDVPDAWTNVGSDCVLRGATLHIAPPP